MAPGWLDVADRVIRETDREFREAAPIPFVHPDSASESIDAIFDEEHELVELQGPVGLSSTAPVLRVRLASFAQPPVAALPPDLGTRATVRGVAYQVVDVRPTGHGDARLVLHRLE